MKKPIDYFRGVACLCLLLLGACSGGGNTNKVTLTIWEDESNISVLKKLTEQFSADYARSYPLSPKVTVEFIPQSEKSAVEKLVDAGPTGNGPDIFSFVHDTLGTAVNSGLIDVNLFATSISQEHSQEAIAALSYEGKLYGYPITSESITVMYDNTLVTKEELSTMEGLVAASKKLAWTFKGDGSAYYTFGLLNDANLFGENGTNKNSINMATTNAVSNYHKAVSSLTAAIEDTNPDTGLALLKEKKVVGIVSAPYLWSSVKQELGNKAAMAVLPMINGQEQRPFSGYKGYGVNPYGKNPAIAHLLANYLVGEDAQYVRLNDKGYLPTIINSPDLEALIAQDAIAQVFENALADSLTMPNILQMGKFWAPMQDACTEIWNNKATVTINDIQSAFQVASGKIIA